MIYEYLCDSCDRKWDRVCRLSEYEANPDSLCPTCGNLGMQVITAPALFTGTKVFEAFVSPVDGTVISNKRELQEHNKRNGVVNLHDGYDEKGVQSLVNKDYQAEFDKGNDKDVRKDAEKAVAKLNDGYKPHVEKDIIP